MVISVFVGVTAKILGSNPASTGYESSVFNRENEPTMFSKGNGQLYSLEMEANKIKTLTKITIYVV